MSLVEKIVDAFDMDDNFFSIKETINYLEIIYTSNLVSLPQSEQIIEIQKEISIRDKLKIDVECDKVEIAQYREINDLQQFINDFKKSIEDEDDIDYKIIIIINKDIVDGNISIYSHVAFIKYLKNLSFNETLYILNNIIKKFGAIYFRTNECFSMNTKSIYFIREDEIICVDSSFRRKNIINRSQNCSYLNTSEYEFLAEDFIQINKSSNIELNKIFFKLAVIYSLIGICDVSVINDNKITYIVNGYRRIENSLMYDNEFEKVLEEYIEIYNWIYNESSKSSCTDKIGIARNVITASIRENNLLHPNEGIFRSVCSAHSIYLKENVKEYLEVKSKISEFNFELMQKMSELSKEIGKSLLNNAIAISTFYGTVFIMNILSDKRLDNIFTKDITNLSVVICIFSLLYMFITLYNIKKDLEIFEMQYNRIKHNYDDVLNSEDRDNIFKNDEYFKNDKKIIQKSIKFYTFIWILVIIILFMLIYHLGYSHVIELLQGFKILIIKQ